MIRTSTKKVRFGRRFHLDSAEEVLPPGTDEVETDEELLEGISFTVFRRVSTLLHLQPQHGVRRTLTIDPKNLETVRQSDRGADEAPEDTEGHREARKSLVARRQAEVDRRAAKRGEDEETDVRPA